MRAKAATTKTDILFPLFTNKLSEQKGTGITLKYTSELKLQLLQDGEQGMVFDFTHPQGVQEFLTFVEEILNQ